MKDGLLISDFHAFETEVQMIIDLMGRKTKILVRISSGKDPHGIILLVVLLFDIAASPKRERDKGLKSCWKEWRSRFREE